MEFAVADRVIAGILAVDSNPLVDLDAVAVIAIDVAMVHEVVVVLEVHAVVENGAAVVVDLQVDELVVVGTRLGDEDPLMHGVADFAVLNPDVVRGAGGGAGGDLDHVGGGVGRVQDQAIEDDVAPAGGGQVHDSDAARRRLDNDRLAGIGGDGHRIGPRRAARDVIVQVFDVGAAPDVEGVTGLQHAHCFVQRAEGLGQGPRVAIQAACGNVRGQQDPVV